MDYGYEGTTVFPFDVTESSQAPPGVVDLKAHVRWLVCREICPPGKAYLGLNLDAVSQVSAVTNKLIDAAIHAELVNLWNEFDAGESYEARFAKAIDRSMPVLLNLNNNGGSWVENGVSYERVVKRAQPEIEGGCPELWEYLKLQLEVGRHKGFSAASAL